MMYTKVITLLFVGLLVVETEAGWLRSLGAAQNERPVDEEIRKMVKEVEPQIKELYPGSLKSIEPLSFKTQVVAGTNYLIRARVTDIADNQAIVHLRIWKTLFGSVRFENIRTKVNEQTPLTSFMSNDI